MFHVKRDIGEPEPACGPDVLGVEDRGPVALSPGVLRGANRMGIGLYVFKVGFHLPHLSDHARVDQAVTRPSDPVVKPISGSDRRQYELRRTVERKQVANAGLK